MKYLLFFLVVASTVSAHGYVKVMKIDGTDYPGYDPMVDARYPGVKRVMWGFPSQNTFGVGPVVDVTSPDITCRKNATPPALKAVARAGAQVKFQWSDYFTSHKGPIMTYLGRVDDPKTKPQDVEFFKIDQGTYDPQTHIWGSDTLIKQNNSWTVTIPSDIKPGNYVMRHEIVALHFGAKGNPNGAGTGTTGAQFYPVCVNMEITGSGSAAPAGVKFPGGYKPSDPGILDNIYYGVNRYIAPGPPTYEGKHDPPQGIPPVVRETGALTGSAAKSYQGAVSVADGILNSIVSGVNNALPGGGGFHWEPNADPSKGSYEPVNGGKPLDALNSPIVTGTAFGSKGLPPAAKGSVPKGAVAPPAGAPKVVTPAGAPPAKEMMAIEWSG